MKPSQFLTLLFLAFSFQASAQNLKALVGGTLIDGFGGTPIRNSVILIEGEGKSGGRSGKVIVSCPGCNPR
ncbi:hypothetical protein [Algoriphagus boritolerans]|uniref:Uncharacterized protein n=1 Tax=Algoriphagus boritolerans DSM 17298 = JCM 18970 TaxID=1120964 RepID=A0A1H5XT36_9BACT|nr:hypothetical protein [Algoriphagus boritolerans]SEG14881.1 hypothetical protein SAMN03080598_02660 [Algoriphagus boritolerans DSM 17298 = JCM 18970]